MNELALFAGAGGGILGGKLLGWTCVCAVEKDPFCQEVLAARQNDGSLSPFPIWDDVTTFDGKLWRGLVDVVSGGFPCQDISQGNPNGAGITGPRSGLWKHMARIIGEVRPGHVLVENSPVLRKRGLDVVLRDLACLGYDATWGVFSGASIGAPHLRKRMWIYAHPSCQLRSCLQMQLRIHEAQEFSETEPLSLPKWETGPFALFQFPGMDDGVAYRLDAIRAIGNGQIPAVVEKSWSVLTQDPILL